MGNHIISEDERVDIDRTETKFVHVVQEAKKNREWKHEYMTLLTKEGH